MLDRLSIRSQAGTLSIQSSPPVMNRSSAAQNLRLQGNTRRTLEIKSTPPRLEIDQSDSFNSVGLPSSLRCMDKNYDRMKQKGSETIDRIVSDGVRYLQIENKGNPTVELARQKMDRQFDKKLSIAAIAPTRISITRGTLDISFSDTTPLESTWQQSEDSYSYTPGDVTVAWRTRPSIQISVIPGKQLSPPVGKQLDTTL